MSNYWNTPGVPHKGWTLVDVHDVRGNGQAEWETDYESCMMCGQAKIRFVHIVSHKDMDDYFRVGCDCAEKLTSDYINPGMREKELKSRAAKRDRLLDKEWKYSKKGNMYLKYDDHRLLIFMDEKAGKWKCAIDDRFGKKSFVTSYEAKKALVAGVFHLQDKAEW